MLEYIGEYWWVILLIGMMIFMHRPGGMHGGHGGHGSGGGCCGGHDEQRDKNPDSEDNDQERPSDHKH